MGKLIKCEACGADISKKAKACPHCGEPVPEPKPKPTSIPLLTVLIVIMIIVWSFNISYFNSQVDKTTTSAVTVPKKLTPAEIEQQKKIREQQVAKAKIANKKKEKEILKRLKTIPSSNFKLNKELYSTLLRFEPDNKKYKEKVKFYTDKFNKAEAKKEEELALRLLKFGNPPTSSAWDGTYHVVERYLKRTAHDPSSIEMYSCTNVRRNKDGWLVGCEYGGKNAFGGMIRKANWFTIRHNTVVRMDKASAY